MKKIEKAALILIILDIIASFVFVAGKILVPALAMRSDSFINPILFNIPFFLVKLSVNIAITVWIYRESKKDGSDAPWVWACLGFVFGVLGAILFYAVRIYEALKIKRSEPIA